MREIRFKYWDRIRNRFETVGYIFGQDGPHFPDYIVAVQYTGLRSFDGQEIYEGDILSKSYGAGAHQRIVQWDVLRARYNVTGLFAKGARVIGNIYENPELTK